MDKKNNKISNGVNIIIMGPQGSGKGTQADIFSQRLGIPHISTGEIFRENIKNQTELGKKIDSIVKSGALVPDEITNEITKQRLEQKDCTNGFILDGFPRNLTQAEFLDKIKGIDLVLEVWISDEEAIKRISQRRTCLKCQKVYHLIYNPPKNDEICGACGEKLVIREDDKPETIKKRLDLYNKETKPLIDYYQKKGVYKKIDGMPPIPEVSRQITEVLKK
ncbi:MAG: adenylate kinase [Patescibacteria group bacterium]|nr:adenylate kinase [Patescibacteria group bacterium]MDD5294500.1 adenylate kinase [Patescibacteria group bacterium]MDD5555005.1 adenylate kinase [Patescibacteria group bacterium]